METHTEVKDGENEARNLQERRFQARNFKGRSKFRVITTKGQRKKKVPITVDRLLGPDGLPLLCKLITQWVNGRDILKERNLNSFLQVYQDWLSVFAPGTPFDDALAKIEKLANHPSLRIQVKDTKDNNTAQNVDSNLSSTARSSNTESELSVVVPNPTSHRHSPLSDAAQTDVAFKTSNTENREREEQRKPYNDMLNVV
jgi:hypothetical protein